MPHHPVIPSRVDETNSSGFGRGSDPVKPGAETVLAARSNQVYGTCSIMAACSPSPRHNNECICLRDGAVRWFGLVLEVV